MSISVLRIAIIVLTLLVAGTAYSDNPSPSGGKESQSKRKISVSDKKQAASDQRGTEEMPLVIKGIPSEKTPEQAKEDREERNAKTANDRALTRYASWQAWFTFALIVVGVFQLALFMRQLGIIRESLAAAIDSANAALETAKSITASERAYVFVKVELLGAIASTSDGTVKTFFTVNFHNYGKTPAIITRWGSDSDIVMINAMPQNLSTTLAVEERLQEGLVIASEGEFPLTISRGIRHGERDEIRRGEKFLICYGQIEYKDILGNIRETGYCWEFKHDRNRFEFCNNSQLNHYT